MNERKILLQQVVADDAGETGAEALGDLFCGRFQFLRPHVVGWRVDEIARQARGICQPIELGGCDAVGRHEADLRTLRLAIAAEAIAAERESERGQPRIMRRIVEAVGARGQQAGQAAGPERVAVLGIAVLDAEQHLRDTAIRTREDQAAAGLGRVSIGLGEITGFRRQRVAEGRPARFRHEGDGNGRWGGGGLEDRWHVFQVLDGRAAGRLRRV